MIHQYQFELYGGPVNTQNVSFKGTLIWGWDANKEKLESKLKLVFFPGFSPLRPGYELKADLYDFSTTETIKVGAEFKQRWLVRAQVIAYAVKGTDITPIDKLTGGFSQPQFLVLDIGRPFGSAAESAMVTESASSTETELDPVVSPGIEVY